jgi:hypothetical protein
MSEQVNSSLEERSRELFHDSVENLDMRMRSRLTRARHAALESTARPRRVRAWWAPVGVTAAAVIAVALWVAPSSHHAPVSSVDGQSIEDLDLLATADENGGDTMEMLQDDPDFYDFADKAAESEPAA